jgi:LmbE family N-acetylglucosaminyl deacetylase
MNILVVVAHPDDEVLGVGGTIARYGMSGHHVEVIVYCGSFQRGTVPYQQQLEKVRQHLYISKMTCFHMVDQDELEFASVQQLANKLPKQGYNKIFTHWSGDLNVDHRRVNEAVHLAYRPNKGYAETELLEFPTPSSTEYSPTTFVPDTWVSIGSFLEFKQRAMSEYTQELQPTLLPRNPVSLEVIARYHGMQVGIPYAEVFKTVRRII